MLYGHLSVYQALLGLGYAEGVERQAVISDPTTGRWKKDTTSLGCRDKDHSSYMPSSGSNFSTGLQLN